MNGHCDLVMRGGITSGTVYPKAIYGLSKSYVFKNIGGASAGAIAAAFTAAAEMNRQSDGFERLNKIPAELNSNLIEFFQPDVNYKKLFDRFVNKLPRIKEIGITEWVLYGFRNRRSLKRLFNNEGDTNYGICPGITVDTNAGKPGLIDWMNVQLEFVSGRISTIDEKLPEKPLTFGDLNNSGVNLKLISTNLSQKRPEELPIKSGFKIKQSDLDWLLPKNIGIWLKKNYTYDGDHNFVEVPHNDEMPVLLAVRMSLSFPILFKAVPFYSYDRSIRKLSSECEVRQNDLKVNYFSDGGISSNFPIHFFDAYLPSRPTFCITLSEYDECKGGKDDEDGWSRIYMPYKASYGLTYPVNSIKNLGSFIMSLLNSAKDWNDSLLMRQPGFRERIVHVALKDGEGGMNLTMDEDVLLRLLKLGDLTAQRIENGHKYENVKQPPFDMEIHRWRRFLSTTEAIDDFLDNLEKQFQALCNYPKSSVEPESMDSFLNRLIEEYQNGSTKFDSLGYEPEDIRDLQNLVSRWEKLIQLNKDWKKLPLNSKWDLPSPSLKVKIRPSEL